MVVVVATHRRQREKNYYGIGNACGQVGSLIFVVEVVEVVEAADVVEVL